MQPLDLSVQPPRSPYVKLGGLYMLARTIDKLRAELPGGTVGTFHIAGFSETLLDDLAIDVNKMREIVAEAKDDEQVVAWFLMHCDTSKFDELNEKMVSRVLNDSNRERLTLKYPVIEWHPEVEKLFDVLDLDDQAQFEGAKT